MTHSSSDSLSKLKEISATTEEFSDDDASSFEEPETVVTYYFT